MRFFEELNDFLPPARRRVEFEIPLDRRTSVKDLIESLGVPHVEVDLVLVDGGSVDFDHMVQPHQRISVYPIFESFDIGKVQRLRPWPLRDPRFVLDVHLGRLARRLRVLGFDTWYRRHAEDDLLARISVDEHRILLTRDRGLLKRRIVTHGTWIRSTDPLQQVREVLDRLQLRAWAHPFGRCPRCNGELCRAQANELGCRVPSRIRENLVEFHRCDGCGQVFWKGSHWERLRIWVRSLGIEVDREETAPTEKQSAPSPKRGAEQNR
jgi:uncharacterized protein with PIN domain